MGKVILVITFVYVAFSTSCSLDKEYSGLSQYENIELVADFASELWIKDNTFKGSFSDDYKTFFYFRKVTPDIELYVPYQSNFKDGKMGAASNCFLF